MKFYKIPNKPLGKNWLILVTPRYNISGFIVGYYDIDGCFKTDTDNDDITDFVESWAELPCFIKV